MTDPVNSSPLPPVPNQISPLSDNGVPANQRGNIDISQYKFSVTWTQWFIQVRDKLNLINSIISAISGLVTGTGFIAANGSGGAVTRTITGTTADISVTNGDGASGNPTIDLIDTAATPGTYGSSTQVARVTVDQKGRITSVSNVTITGGGGGGGAMTLIGTATVAGSAATTLTLSSLDLATDGRYIVFFAFANATASSSALSLYYNADTTATHYYKQGETFNNTSVVSTRANDGIVMTLDASETCTGQFEVYPDFDGKARAIVKTNRGAPASIVGHLFYHVWNSATNVTSITISSATANALDVGSYIKVFNVN